MANIRSNVVSLKFDSNQLIESVADARIALADLSTAVGTNWESNWESTSILLEDFLLKRKDLFDIPSNASDFMERLMLAKEQIALQESDLNSAKARIALIERELKRGINAYVGDNKAGSGLVP